MVQETVVVAEDVPLGDGVVGVVGSEFRQCPIGDVLLSVGAVLIVGIERKALEAITRCEYMRFGNQIRRQSAEICPETVVANR